MENLQVQCFHSTFFGSIPSISNISLLSAISQFELLLAQKEHILSNSFPANLRPEKKHHGWLASIIYSYIYCNKFFFAPENAHLGFPKKSRPATISITNFGTKFGTKMPASPGESGENPAFPPFPLLQKGPRDLWIIPSAI